MGEIFWILPKQPMAYANSDNNILIGNINDKKLHPNCKYYKRLSGEVDKIKGSGGGDASPELIKAKEEAEQQAAEAKAAKEAAEKKLQDSGKTDDTLIQEKSQLEKQLAFEIEKY